MPYENTERPKASSPLDSRPMSQTDQLLVFYLDDRPYALPLSAVERAVRAVEVTTVADAPAPVMGLVNVQGEVMPTIDMRRYLAQPGRIVQLSDQMIVVRSGRRAAALLVDRVSGDLEAMSEDIRHATPGSAALKVIKIRGRIVPVQDVEQLLDRCDGVALPTTEGLAGVTRHADG